MPMDGRKWLPRVYEAFFGTFRRLLPSQKAAIPVVLNGRNILLVAPTGTGKTEAVVAPLAEKALSFCGQTFALYIAPTRALANDLEQRLKEPLQRCGLRLAIRHGERNTIIGKQPPAFVLTTPESLEVMLSVQPEYVKERLREVRAIIVDEAHQFFGTRRGLQLYCLLERLKHYAKRSLQRICLSATVSDPQVVADFFRGSDDVMEVVTVPGKRQIDVRISFVGAEKFNDFGDAVAAWLREILAVHRKVLVFANTRAQCEWLCWQLDERLGKRDGVPVLLHYSSLHQDSREWVEREFRQRRQAVCIATSTLELGIDIGDVDAVAMWGAPNSVSSFVQRLGRGNRRTDIGLVYAACPQFQPSGGFADPDSELLTFVALLRCAQVNELEARSQPYFYSVLLQQLLALSCQWGCVAPDAFTATVQRSPDFVDEKALVEILNSLTEQGVLERDNRRNLWLPTEKFHKWRVRGMFWSNIGEQQSAVVVSDAAEQSVPLTEISYKYASKLRPGKGVVLAGKPRLVTDVGEQRVWVTDLDNEHAELPKYLTPPEPVSETVAQAIREALTMPDEQLAALPIRYDDWARQRLRDWRQRLGSRLRNTELVTEWFEGRWVLYTFFGSASNWLLRDWVRMTSDPTADTDAWRLFCSRAVAFKALANVDEGALNDLVEQRWRSYLQRLALPPLFKALPEKFQKAEVHSILELAKVVRECSYVSSRSTTLSRHGNCL